MHQFEIYFDGIQEGQWFKALNRNLSNAELKPFPSKKEISRHSKKFQEVLSFDRPDIVLCHNNEPILVIERTIEVPSGHNVGQRFARLVAAAKEQVPVIYFGPYAAYKHGGSTQGPRYMNLRLFQALKEMAKTFDTYVTTMNWPVDSSYEIIKSAKKDETIIEFLDIFFKQYNQTGLKGLNKFFRDSDFEKKLEAERKNFIKEEIKNPEQYDGPPDSVSFVENQTFLKEFAARLANQKKESVLYDVGMTYVRSDPYTGMALLYTFLYCGGLEKTIRNLILKFPNISLETWNESASNGDRKDIRLYRMTADAVLFKDHFKISGKF